MDNSSGEANYQQALLQAILYNRDTDVFEATGVKLYRRNLYAAAGRSLAITFPTLGHLIGIPLMHKLAWEYLSITGRTVFDWGEWGKSFPVWLSEHPLSEKYAYLVDCARLDWRVHTASRAKDAVFDPESFSSLGGLGHFRFSLQFAPGTTLLNSRFPIVAIYQAHQIGAAGADLGEARTLLRQHKGQKALIWRQGLITRVREIDEDETQWFRLLDGSARTVADLLPQRNSCAVPFEDWLARAIGERLVIGLQ